MKKSFIVVVLALFLCGGAWAAENFSDKPIIDEKFREVELEINKKEKPCIKKGPIKVISCVKEISKPYRQQGELRGTDEYCKKHYSDLSFDELRKVWQELKQKRRKARIRPDEKIFGELTEGMFMVEQIWVESRLADMQSNRTKALEKGSF